MIKKDWRKILLGLLVVGAGTGTVLNATGLDNLFEPDNFKWFQDLGKKEAYDYVAGDGEETDLADQDRKSEDHSGNSEEQSVQLASLNLLSEADQSQKSESGDLGLADNKTSTDEIRNGVDFVDSDQTDNGNLVQPGENGSGTTSDGNGDNGGQNGNGDSGNSDNGNGGDNSNNGNNGNGGNNGGDHGNNGDNGNNGGGTIENWVEDQLKPKDPVETPEGTLIGLSAVFQKTNYCTGDSYSGEDAVVTATYLKDGQKIRKTISYGGSDGYSILFSSNGKGTLYAVFSYKGMTARAPYVMMDRYITAKYFIHTEVGGYTGESFPSDVLMEQIREENPSAATYLQELTNYPGSFVTTGEIIDLLEIHKRMIAYLGDEEIITLFKNSGSVSNNYPNIGTLQTGSDGYLTNLLTGFRWVRSGKLMDGKSYIYYPAGEDSWENGKNLCDYISESNSDFDSSVFKVKREVEGEGDWSTYMGDQTLEKYLGSDAVMDVPVGVTKIALDEKNDSVETVKIPESVQIIDSATLGKNLPNLKAYELGDTKAEYKRVYQVIDGILYTDNGKTLVSVPAGIEQVVIPAEVTKLQEGCLKNVKASQIEFLSETAPEIEGDTGYSGKIIVPDSDYDLTCKAYQFAFGSEDIRVDIRAKSQEKGLYTYIEEGPVLIARGTGAKQTLLAVPTDMKDEYRTSDDIAQIGGYAFVGCTKLSDITLGEQVKKLEENSLVLPSNITGITLEDSWVQVEGNVFGDPKDGYTVPDIKIYVSADDYDAYLESWSEVLDPIYGEGTAEKLLTTEKDDVFYENNLKYRRHTENGTETYELLKVLNENVTTLQIKEGTTEIAEHAFSGCDKLEILLLPDSLTELPETALEDCTVLETVAANGNKLELSGRSAGAEILTAGETYTGFTLEGGALYAENTDGTYTLINVGTDTTGAFVVKDQTSIIYQKAFKDCTGLSDVDLENDNVLKEIGDHSFDNCQGMKILNLEKYTAITKVGSYAFRNCHNLTAVVLPATVTELETATFYGCESLKNVSAKGILKIGDEVFANCRELVAVGTDDNVQILGDRAYYNCKSIQNLFLGEALTQIGEECFGNCVSLTQVDFNGTLTGISRYCFYGCTKLSIVNFGDAQKAALRVIGVEAFGGCTSLRTLDLRGMPLLQQMGQGTFKGCDELLSVKLPENLEKIPDSCFEDCGNLSLVQINSEEMPELGENIFGEALNDYVHVQVPESYLEDFENGNKDTFDTAYGDGSLADILGVINDKQEFIKGIEYELTDEGRILKKADKDITGEYTIDEDVIRIEDDAFAGCTGVTAITIPYGGDIELGDRCFKGCTGLESVKLYRTVSKWGDETFMDCTGMTKLLIGFSIQQQMDRLGSRAFKNCTGLDNDNAISIYCMIPTWGEECFAGCTNLTAVGMTNQGRASVVTLEDRVFDGCSSLRTFMTTGLSSLQSIGDHAFRGCNSQAKPSLAASVTHLGEGCFMNSTGLQYVSIYGAIEEYPKDAFKNCPNLIRTGGTGVAFNSLKRIGESAYEGCTSLTNSNSWKLERYENLEEIGDNAFKGCSNLTWISVPETVTKIGADAFTGCIKAAYLQFIGETVPEIGSFSVEGFPADFAIVVKDSENAGDQIYLAYREALNKALGEELTYELLNSESDGAKDRHTPATAGTDGTDGSAPDGNGTDGSTTDGTGTEENGENGTGTNGETTENGTGINGENASNGTGANEENAKNGTGVNGENTGSGTSDGDNTSGNTTGNTGVAEESSRQAATENGDGVLVNKDSNAVSAQPVIDAQKMPSENRGGCKHYRNGRGSYR